MSPFEVFLLGLNKIAFKKLVHHKYNLNVYKLFYLFLSKVIKTYFMLGEFYDTINSNANTYGAKSGIEI